MAVTGIGSDRLNGVYAASAPAYEVASNSGTSRSVAARDGVTLSNVASQIRTTQQAIGDLPDVREDRVAELKAKIDAGAYNPSAQDIAEKMIGG